MIFKMVLKANNLNSLHEGIHFLKRRHQLLLPYPHDCRLPSVRPTSTPGLAHAILQSPRVLRLQVQRNEDWNHPVQLPFLLLLQS